jgi:hypothetical protein
MTVRPGVEIELESRSKGFQWFFSFYLVFLVESDLEHRDAILLLDEPGIHLHMTAQAELLDLLRGARAEEPAGLHNTRRVAHRRQTPNADPRCPRDGERFARR